MLNKKYVFILSAILAVILFISSCALISQIKSRLNITECKFRISRVGKVSYNPLTNADNVGIKLFLECKNPNKKTETILDKIDFDFFVNRKKVTTGIIDKQIKVPPQQTEEFPVDLNLSISKVGNTLLQAIREGKAKYFFTGTAYIQTDLGEMNFDVKIKEGEWSM